MSQFQVFDPPVPSNAQPACPKCRGPVWLVSIEPDEPHFDRRTFACGRCEHQQTVIVKYD